MGCAQSRSRRLFDPDLVILHSIDPDVIIPDATARPLLLSSSLMLITAVLALLHGEFSITLTSSLLWLTSVLHWHSPRFSSVRRRADYAAVVAALTNGCWVASTRARSPAWSAFWWVGISAVALLFTCNETAYYIQVMKTPLGGSKAVSECPGLPATAEGSVERDLVYCRTMWVHLICVHVLANFLAVCLVLWGLCPPAGCAAQAE